MMSKSGQYVGNGVSVKITTERSLAHEANPDLELAEKLKYSEPEKAVEIFCHVLRMNLVCILCTRLVFAIVI